MVDDYIELRGPDWPVDKRFFVDVVDPWDQDSWLRVPFVAGDGLHAEFAVDRREAGHLLAWVTAYENNSTGTPYVGQAIVVRETSTVARLDFVEFVDGVSSTVVLDVVRTATHAAANAGATTVVTQLDVKTWTSPASAPPLTVSWRSTRAFSTRTRRLLTRFSTMPTPFPDDGDEIETAQGAIAHEHDSRVSSTACGTGYLEPNH